MTDERARADARMAAHRGRRAEAERTAGRRVADQEAAAAARAATPEGQAARIVSGIFGTSARRADGNRIVDGLNLDR